MSTNNNLLGKEIRPLFTNDTAATSAIKKFSGAKFQTLITNTLADCTAVSLSNRGIQSIEDFSGFSKVLRRLDLSENELVRLRGCTKLLIIICEYCLT